VLLREDVVSIVKQHGVFPAASTSDVAVAGLIFQQEAVVTVIA